LKIYISMGDLNMAEKGMRYILLGGVVLFLGGILIDYYTLFDATGLVLVGLIAILMYWMFYFTYTRGK
jgi:hypothetical protein